MKKGILFLLFYVVFFEGYSQQRIEGNVGDAQINKIYLFEVVNEFREIYRVIDSAEVHKGNFEFVLNEMTPELYFVGDNLKHGGYFFLNGKNVKLTAERVTEEGITWSVKGSPLINCIENSPMNYMLPRTNIFKTLWIVVFFGHVIWAMRLKWQE